MDKKILKEYRALKREVKLIDKKLDKLYDRQQNVPEVMGKVSGSSRDFPYTEVRTTVRMRDPQQADHIKFLIRQKEQRKEKAERRLVEIEEFISGIPDSDTRQIFELLYIDGMKQREVAERIGYTQGRIAQIISAYLKD